MIGFLIKISFFEIESIYLLCYTEIIKRYNLTYNKITKSSVARF